MEHLQLVFIRWQDATSAPSLPIPVRLADWIRRYPAVLHKPPTQPRPAARTVRILAVRRNVRIYSPDLVKSAASWASPKNALSNEWARIAPFKLPPRYSDAYRKRMAMPGNFHPDTGSLSPPPLAAASSSDSLCAPRSLTDLKWGEFESMGFATLDDAKKLQFDLTESARTERSAKRESLNWADFSSTGFSRGDAPLSATLQFSTPVANTISSWPAHHAEIDKKVKNTEKALPPFGWDTEPVIVNEEIIEEAFVDVFCDLLYGGGWMDLESSERECNWALVEFKSLPPNRSTVSGDADPRTSTSLILFEEFVPLEYRQQLAIPPSARRRRLPSLFTTSLKSPSTKSKSKSKSKSSSMTTYTNTKGWKQAPTLNGRPYVVGHVPRSPTSREVEFEEILRRDAGTKVIRLGARESVPPSVQMEAEPEEEEPERKKKISGPLYVEPHVETERAPAPAPKSDSAHSQSESESTGSGSAKRSRGLFRLPVNVPVSVNVTGGGGGGVSPARRRVGAAGEWEFEFEFGTGRGEGRAEGDEAWVDILVGRRGGGVELGKDLELDKDKDKDPDVVSREVERVLAGVRDQTRERERAVSIGSRVDGDSEGGLDRFYVERVSEESRYTDEREEQHEEAQQTQQTQQPRRRMGYFDLHPERRIVGRGCEDEEGEGEEEGKERGLGGRAVVRKLPVPPAHAPPSPVPVIKIEPYTVDPQSQSQSQKHALAKQPASPNGHGHGHGHGHAQPAPAAAPISKTAALIEMYRERERASSLKSGSVSMAAPMTAPMTAQVPTQVPTTPTTPTTPTQVQVQVPTTPTQMPMPTTPTQTQPQASQLPARSSSLMKEGGGGVVPLAAPVPKVAVQALVGPGPLEPPRVGGEGTGTGMGTAGRASPGRYVHGAPLHNVLEEEEEE
ncbi:hypothetical protein H2248_001917 [Termitomyces sp. 'cryptogamus']|nr:hypothetical protein H2248_001917 [Termitomyces sp. 'cryptogamus']